MDTNPTRLAYTTADPEAPQPLTSDVLARLNDSMQIASDVRSRLINLRDRVFGAQPEAVAPGSMGVSKEPHCFADAARLRGLELRDVLYDIDRLSGDLNNRL